MYIYTLVGYWRITNGWKKILILPHGEKKETWKKFKLHLELIKITFVFIPM